MINLSKKSFLYSSISLACLLSIYSCDSSNSTSSRIKPEVKDKINYSFLKSQNLGNVSVKVNTANILKKGSFEIKAVDFRDRSIRKLKLEVIGLGITTPLSQIVNWKPNTVVSFSLLVPSGNNRILILSALDAGGDTIAQLSGALNINAGENNAGKISQFDTAIAQTLIEILDSNNPTALNNINLANLNTFFTNITGFNSTDNTFTKISPLFVNSRFIGQNVITNGSLPVETDPNLEDKGSLNVTLNVTGANLILSDLSSQEVNSTTSLTTTINDVTTGEWYLTIQKDGYEDQSIEVDVNGLNTPVNVTLRRLDLRSTTEISAQSKKGRLTSDQYDEEFETTLSDYSFETGTDTNNDGGANENANGFIEIAGLGKHKISLSQENYPTMDNREDSVIITDETTGNVRTFTSDQELQKYHISDGTTTISIETNPDGTYLVNGETANTAFNAATLAMISNVFSNTSPHSLSIMLEIFRLHGKINGDFEETLGSISGPQNNTYAGTIGDPIALLKEGFKLLIAKNKAALAP